MFAFSEIKLFIKSLVFSRGGVFVQYLSFCPFSDDTMTRQRSAHSSSGGYLFRSMFCGSAPVPQNSESFFAWRHWGICLRRDDVILLLAKNNVDKKLRDQTIFGKTVSKIAWKETKKSNMVLMCSLIRNEKKTMCCTFYCCLVTTQYCQFLRVSSYYCWKHSIITKQQYKDRKTVRQDSCKKLIEKCD